GSGVPARRQHVVQAREPPRRMLARPAHRRPDRHARAGVVPDRRPGLSGDRPGPAHALAATTTSSLGNPPESNGGSGVNNRHSASSALSQPLTQTGSSGVDLFRASAEVPFYLLAPTV